MAEPRSTPSSAAPSRDDGWTYVPAPSSAPPPAMEIGGKGHNLARLAALAIEQGSGFEVPRFVVVRAPVFDRLVCGAAAWPATAEESKQRREEVRAMPLGADVRSEIGAALERGRLSSALLAVRSSAANEDGTVMSFAGQFDSVLGVRADAGGEPLWDALRQVWASAFHERAAAYQATGDSVRMAVVIQEMVDPAVSGVAFSADPVTGDRDTSVVSAVYGLGEGLVSGELDADTYRVSFAGEEARGLERSVVVKDHAVRLAPAGRTRVEPVPEPLRNAPALTDDEARRIATCARALERALGAPQDIEWALVERAGAERRLVVLQARPITTLGTGGLAREPETGRSPERRLWDNSNIAESYGGVTTPLTFTFARRVYEDVYRQFCRLMGVSDRLIDQHREVFAHMLGLIRGRVYYNLLNWYRTLALLPGFTFNRSFMERMMGVGQKLENPPEPPRTGSRASDLGRLIRMAARMIRESRRLSTEVPAFHARLEAALGPLAGEEVSSWPAERSLALYHRLEEELLRHWRAPLVNDFFAMIYFGVLCRLTEKWLPDSPATLVNDLMCGEGGIISTEPARRVMSLARRVTESPALTALFASGLDEEALWKRLATDTELAPFHRELQDYVGRFGDRCTEELKLETVTLGEDPSFLVKMIAAYVASDTIDPEKGRARETAIRRDAEARVRARLRGPRRAVFMAVLARARRRVRDRENLRFERTRVFGVVRRIFLSLGRDLAGRGLLDQQRDVFYLTLEELFAHFDGTGVTQNLASLARLRRAEFEGYARTAAPPDRFETLGPPGEWGPVVAEGSAPAKAGASVHAATELRGTGCCPGVVRAPVRIVRDPRSAGALKGHILVAERTDPGWVLLFPAVEGLLVQRGSLLSHSAIVAREMGLPCVVGLAGLLDTLRDGEEVEMDGTTGVVRRLVLAS